MKYEHILSPVTISGRTFKSRLLGSKFYSMTANDFEDATKMYTNMAQNGCAMVCMTVGTWPDCEGKRSPMSNMPMEDPEIEEGFRKMIGEVHKYGTFCSASLMSVEPQELAISDTPNWGEFPLKGDYNPNVKNKPGISAERLEGMIRDYVYQCGELKRIGFDGATFYMCYRASILGNALSPTFNKRTDKYGGKTVEERSRLSREVFTRVKEACGQDFIIEIQISAEEEQPGYTAEDWVEYCKLCEGVVDIFQVRGWDGSNTHVNSYISTKENPSNLRFAEAFKKADIKALVSPVGGFGDVDMLEKFIAEGRTDMVSMARMWMADSEYGTKIKEERSGDVIPCLYCMKCHNPVCAVNPGGISARKEPAEHPKRVAVVGGGPAGMRLAIEAEKLGHKITLFEKTDTLGGQLKHADYPSFKWSLRDYKDWLIRQLQKSSVDVRLGVEATPELLKAGNYDAVVCALGSDARGVPVKGADTSRVWSVDDVYEHEKELGERIVVVGGASSGRETALFLAQCGHKVTMLTRGQELYTIDAHCIYAIQNLYESQPKLQIVEFASTKEIGDNYVVCDIKHGMPKRKLTFNYINETSLKLAGEPVKLDGFLYYDLPRPVPFFMMPEAKEGGPGDMKDKPAHGVAHAPEVIPVVDESLITVETKRIDCDAVVVSGGRAPRIDDLKRFKGVAPRVFVIGDNVAAGTVQECSTTAYATALEL